MDGIGGIKGPSAGPKPLEGNITNTGNTANPRGRAGELKKAVTEFEAVFINQMLKAMRSTVEKNPLIHGGVSEDIYMSLFDAEISKLMAEHGRTGLAEVFIRQLLPERPGVEAGKLPEGTDDVRIAPRTGMGGKKP